MAETLTMEPNVETTTLDNLSAEEQNSLEIGEQMQQAQDNLLAGKYKNAEELEKGYLELQQKLGEDEQPQEENEEGEYEEEYEEGEYEEDLDLEAIIRELEGEEAEEGEEEMSEEEETEEEDSMEEQSDSSDIGKGDNKLDYADSKDEEDPGKGDLTKGNIGEGEGDGEDVDLEEIIRALKEEEGDEEPVAEEGRGDKEVDETETEAELDEAYKVIRFLKSKINEVNLLNAKLLFSNKLFRNHNLNENQKMKVIENFDRAQSLREVKLVFATLSESFKFGGKQKRSIKESYASKTSRSTRPNKKIISEGSALQARWKKLANL